jgi:hypothetical protein
MEEQRPRTDAPLIDAAATMNAALGRIRESLGRTLGLGLPVDATLQPEQLATLVDRVCAVAADRPGLGLLTRDL